jgi:cyclase
MDCRRGRRPNIDPVTVLVPQEDTVFPRWCFFCFEAKSMQQLSANVFVETGFKGSNNTFVVTTEGVVMIDPPEIPGDALRWRNTILDYGSIKYLINTEPHRDHTAGNIFFDGLVMAHEGTRRAVVNTPIDSTNPDVRQFIAELKPRPPVITFTEDLTLYLGDHTFSLILTPGHTPYNIAVYIREEKVIVTGDTVMNNLLPGLHEALPFEWLESLGRLQCLGANVIVPGHGAVCDTTYLPQMRANILEQIDAVAAAIRQGKSPAEILSSLSFVARYPPPSPPPNAERDNLTRLVRILSGSRID